MAEEREEDATVPVVRPVTLAFNTPALPVLKGDTDAHQRQFLLDFVAHNDARGRIGVFALGLDTLVPHDGPGEALRFRFLGPGDRARVLTWEGVQKVLREEDEMRATGTLTTAPRMDKLASNTDLPRAVQRYAGQTSA